VPWEGFSALAVIVRALRGRYSSNREKKLPDINIEKQTEIDSPGHRRAHGFE
jgi:hypothetical protein